MAARSLPAAITTKYALLQAGVCSHAGLFAFHIQALSVPSGQREGLSEGLSRSRPGADRRLQPRE